MRTTWTKEEEQFIINNYKNLSDKQLSTYLYPHTENSIANKRKKLGCIRQKLRHSYDDVIKAFNQTDYILLSLKEDFKDMATNSLKYICPKHKDKGIQTISLGHLESGRGCYWCGRESTINARKTGFTTDKINQDKKLCESKGFIYIETKKIANKINIGFICKNHKNAGVQYMRRGNMNRDNIIGCKYCLDNKKYKFSKGEQRIENFLQDNSYEYIKEYTFGDCRDIGLLPFDFYLINNNVIIEFDGQHHFMPVNFNGISDEEALKNFNSTQKHDRMKNDYCKKNNIELIRIPYWDYKNIEEILTKKLCS